MKNARAKRAKILFFIVKYANLWGFCCRRRRGCVSSLLTPYDLRERVHADRQATRSIIDPDARENQHLFFCN